MIRAPMKRARWWEWAILGVVCAVVLLAASCMSEPVAPPPLPAGASAAQVLDHRAALEKYTADMETYRRQQEAWGGLLTWGGAALAVPTGGVSTVVGGLLAAWVTRRRTTAALVQPIEEARDRDAEKRLGTDDAGRSLYIVVRRDRVTVEHRRRRVSRAIARATNGRR